ncbi:calcium/sodium antiporter [Patescibacteria group bacterium]|nr:calcium/sodium antiporter [Patescibacteria group bacterium]
MFLTVTLFILGLFLVIKGADFLVEGASSVARKFNVSFYVIGLTVVAFGTSAPELIVSTFASFMGSEGLALGNIIGSNLSNTLLILGVVALISPLTVSKNTVHKEIPFSLLAIFAVSLLLNDLIIDHSFPNSLTRIDGTILILFFVIFMYYTFGISRIGTIEKFSADGVHEKSGLISTLMVVLGLVGLGVGGKLIVDGGVEFAKIFGLSEALIGLSIVALGTSLPELATSAVAAYKGKTDMAIGNVIGSNIFNILWVLGLSAVIHPIEFDPLLNVDIILLFAVTILLLLLIYTGKKNVLSKFEGMILILIYIFYLIHITYRG